MGSAAADVTMASDTAVPIRSLLILYLYPPHFGRERVLIGARSLRLKGDSKYKCTAKGEIRAVAFEPQRRLIHRPSSNFAFSAERLRNGAARRGRLRDCLRIVLGERRRKSSALHRRDLPRCT